MKRLHEEDLAKGYGAVYLPYALERKYPHANREWRWQYVFPSNHLSVDPPTGIVRRRHLDENGLQRAIRQAARDAHITRPVSPHTFCHSLATHLLENGYDIHTQGREDHHDLHPCPPERPHGRSQPIGFTSMSSVQEIPIKMLSESP